MCTCPLTPVVHMVPSLSGLSLDGQLVEQDSHWCQGFMFMLLVVLSIDYKT